MKPLFKGLILDVDGVLNQCPNGGLCGERLKLLDKIIKETGCFIIISSTWRNHPSQFSRLVEELSKLGVKEYDVTPTFDGHHKSYEIHEYLEQTDRVFKSCVILDDDVSQGDTYLPVVRTDSFEGLTPFLATCVINLLNH